MNVSFNYGSFVLQPKFSLFKKKTFMCFLELELCIFHRYLYGFEDYCTSTGVTFRMDLPLKATERPTSHTDRSLEGPADGTNSFDAKPDPEISLIMKNVVKVTAVHLSACHRQLLGTQQFCIIKCI